MPILEFGDLESPVDHYFAVLTVWSVMMHPSDETGRREYIASTMAYNLGALRAGIASLPDPERAPNWTETIKAVNESEAWLYAWDRMYAFFERHGGYAAVASAPDLGSVHREKQVGSWYAAGLILALISRMAYHHGDLPGGASVNKAVYILERAGLPPVPQNRHDIRVAWRTYRSVAHLCAALFDLFCEVSLAQPDSQVGPAMEARMHADIRPFLAEAERYQEFGLTYFATRAKAQPLLNADEIWRLPESRQWPKSPVIPAPLDGLLLEAARDYRAPIPGV